MQQQQQAPPPPGYQQPPQAVGYQPPPPPPGYAGGQQVFVGGMVAPLPMFRDVPVAMKCQFCHASITTATRFETGSLTWIVCGVLLLFGLWLGCCLIPFCLDGCKDCIHSCPNCKQIVGKFNRM